MNMHPVDWCIVAGLMVVLIAAAAGTYRYTRSVGAFLTANRCGGHRWDQISAAAADVHGPVTRGHGLGKRHGPGALEGLYAKRGRAPEDGRPQDVASKNLETQKGV